MSLAKALQGIQLLLGDRLRLDAETLEAHSKDVCHHPPSAPNAVAYPETSDEAAQVLSICQANRTPVVPFGAGTGVEGGVVAIRGGVAVDTSRMDRIVRVSELDRDCTVEAGVTRLKLNAHLEPMGLFFPVDPGADASLGGMAATSASGSSAVKYGTMRDNTLGLTAVTIDGRVIRTGGRVRKSSSGYDLTRLLVGSEGTLALITEVTLKLHRLPAAASCASCCFADIESAVEAAITVMAEGVDVARLELLDETLIDAVNQYSGLNQHVAPSLLMEFHGRDERHVAELASQAGAITQRFGGRGFRWAANEDDRRRIWQARYDSYYACLALRKGAIGYVSDVCVPITNLAECIRFAKSVVATTSIPSPLFGHVGDGNFHVVMLIEPGDEAELAEAKRVNAAIVDKALELNGTCTGEHGIGLGKIDALRAEHGVSVDVMAEIKRALDPFGLMNPGKVLALSR